MSLTQVGPLSLTEAAISLRVFIVDHAIVVYSRAAMRVDILQLYLIIYHCEGGATMEFFEECKFRG